MSHWDSTFSWTFCGRWVATSRCRPYLRPSAAMFTAWRVAAATTGWSGRWGQTLCASSITTRTGRRSARRSHSASRIAAAVSERSSGVVAPRSATRHRQSSRARSPRMPLSSRALDHRSQRISPRLRIRCAKLGMPEEEEDEESVVCSSSSFMPPASRSTRSRNAPYSSRSVSGSSPATAAWSDVPSSKNRRRRRSSEPAVALRMRTLSATSCHRAASAGEASGRASRKPA